MKIWVHKANAKKECIETSVDIHNAEKVTLDIVVEFVPYNDIAASSDIKPVYDPKTKMIDEQALADYNDFIIEVVNTIENRGFTVLDVSSSNSSETSMYYTLADTRQVNENDIDLIIFLRISDHMQRITKTQKEWIEDTRNATAEKYKQPKTKQRQLWAPRTILVNNNQFDTYDEAIIFVEQKADDWKRTIDIKRKNRK